MKLGALIYLHDIRQTRMTGTSCKNFEVFRKLSGEDAYERVVIATTMWRGMDEDRGGKRERQLKNEYFKDVVDRGAAVCRYMDSQASARKILDVILNKTGVVASVLGVRRKADIVIACVLLSIYHPD